MSMLQITSTSLSHILHWFIHVVDNFNAKTSLICNESLFLQTYMIKTLMHFICNKIRVSHLRDFSTSSKSDIKPIDYVRNFVLDKHFVM